MTEAEELLDKYEKKDIEKNGKGSAYIEKTNYLVEKYKTALFFIFVQLLVILLLIFGYLSVKKSTVVEVVLPKIVKDTDYGKLHIGIDTSNELYYKVMGSYIVNTILNTDKNKIEKDSDILKKMMFPEVEKHYEKKIDSYKNFIIKNDAKVKYTEISEKVSISDKGEALFESYGKVNIQLGQYKTKTSLCTTSVKMVTKNYMLFVTSFVKECNDNSSSTKDENK